MFEIKYRFEFFCFPIWIREVNNDCKEIFENISLDELPIVVDDLKEQIKFLDSIYQSTYNDEYPPEPIELSNNEELTFCMGVIKSSLKLKESLPLNYKLLFDISEWENRLESIGNIKKETDILAQEDFERPNDKIEYSIISRGEMIINYKDKKIRVTGELIFDPPIFYADLVTIQKSKEFTEDEKNKIIEFITNESQNTIGTKIIFD